jgi:cholesterol oxidase
MQFHLTIIASECDVFTKFNNKVAKVVGTVSCRALSPDPLMVTNGKFRMYVEDETRVDTARMAYDMHLLDTDGKRYIFNGFKQIKNANIFKAWEQTSTLYVTVKTCDKPSNIIGLGVLRAGVSNFLNKLTSLKVSLFYCKSTFIYLFHCPITNIIFGISGFHLD